MQLRSGSDPATGQLAADGRRLVRRPHGVAARLCVEDESGASLPVATLLRAATAAGLALQELGDGIERPLWLSLGPAGTKPAVVRRNGRSELRLDGPALAALTSPLPADELLLELLGPGAGDRGELPRPSLAAPATRALFFESVMSSSLQHNEQEISQGVLHMVGALRGTPTQGVLVNLKMPLGGHAQPLRGLDELAERIAEQPVGLVCLTLLEDYVPGARHLLETLRQLGCQAHVAVGGVMPTLSPQHVAAHLPEVSFVCRGAGETFVPRLAAIVGSSDVSQPFTADQCAALMALDGILAIDRAGQRLVVGNSSHIAEVADLGAVELDLAHLQARHIEGGIEISTARGCIHHCTFCSIIGRQRYQARQAGDVFRLLGAYQARFAELFGRQVPRNAYRVHISDDDFACDRKRAAAILEGLLETPFRLSSVQLSIADLCRQQGGRLLPEPDLQLLDALRPECFADARRDLSPAQLLSDYGERNWSSFLQIGVESFSDAELRRLAKGYRVAHVRAVVGALSARGLHMDAYLILSNSETTADDLVDSLEEIARLKLRHPWHFHLRHPAVPRLVSYFPSTSHRVKQRQGKVHTMALRDHAQVPGHPELDYPFVECDLPTDPWVCCATEQEFLSDARRYTDSLLRLRDLWLHRVRELPEGEERRAGEQLVRRLEDRPRLLVFERLREARQQAQNDASEDGLSGRDPRSQAEALAAAREVMGPDQRWLRAFRRFEHQETPRLVVIPTWQCELRCRYCYVAKQPGRVMSWATLERSVDMLLGSDRPRLMLQFFGGEPLCAYPLVQRAIEHATALAQRRGREVCFLVSSNGYSLDEDKLAWFAQHPVKLELSLDGDAATQNAYRHAADADVDSYLRGISSRVDAIHRSGLRYDVIMVVHPTNVDKLAHNFFHIADLGFRRIQVNFGLGAIWTPEHLQRFAAELHRVGLGLRKRWDAGESLAMVNLEHNPLPMRLNGEITVDHDGAIYGGNGFLHETAHKGRFVIGHLDDLGSFDRYWLDAPSNEYLLEWTYPPEVTANNLLVGRVVTSFVRWMLGEGVPAN